MDVEADEVDIGKALADEAGGEANNQRWEQWCSIVERGRPNSLKLIRLNPPRTSLRAPGPGPFRKKEWKAASDSLLRHRHVVLHADGATAFKLTMGGGPYV